MAMTYEDGPDEFYRVVRPVLKPIRAIRSFPGYSNHAVEWDMFSGPGRRTRKMVIDMMEALYWTRWS